MKKPTLLRNLTVAIIISLVALGTLFILQQTLSDYIAVKITLVLLTLGYLAYLYCSSLARPGKATLALLSVLTIIVVLIVNQDISILISSLLATIWLNRSFLFYQSMLASLVDMALCLIGFSAAFGAFLLSASVTTAIWCFLLVQALFAFIPKRQSARQNANNDATTRPFNKAYQSAESALRQLANKN